MGRARMLGVKEAWRACPRRCQRASSDVHVCTELLETSLGSGTRPRHVRRRHMELHSFDCRSPAEMRTVGPTTHPGCSRKPGVAATTHPGCSRKPAIAATTHPGCSRKPAIAATTHPGCSRKPGVAAVVSRLATFARGGSR
eukprot:365281-Chlamydomonas_euryale.AAC.7